MTAESDLIQFIASARKTVAFAYDGSAFSAAYSAHCALRDQIHSRCADPVYYQEHLDAVKRLMPGGITHEWHTGRPGSV